MIVKRETSLDTSLPEEDGRARKRLDYIERKGQPVRDREYGLEPEPEPVRERVRDRGRER